MKKSLTHMSGFFHAMRLATQAKIFDQLRVRRCVCTLQILKKATAVVDLADQAVTGMMILLVDLEMLGEVFDFLRERRDLDLTGTGVTVVTLKLLANG